MSVPDKLTHRLNNCSSLVSLPAIALQVIDMAEDPDVGLSDVERTIRNDPALSAKLIRVANSPLFARTKNIDSILQALTLLGLDSALSLALSFSLMGSLKKEDGGQDSQTFWQRSIIAAIIARELGDRAAIHNQGALFLAGLLQDLGILALKQLEPETYTELFVASTDHASLCKAEKQHFACDHAAIGAQLAEAWHLPALLINTIANSHSLNAEPNPDEEGLFQNCIGLSGIIADLWIGDNGLEYNEETANTLKHLGIDEQQMESLVDKVLQEIPELSKLFEVELINNADVEAVLARSKDVLMIRDLHKESQQQRPQTDHIDKHSRKVTELSKRDRLSGLYNRAHLEKILNMEFDSACHHGSPLSLAFIDVDHFEDVNKRYGQSIGDIVIKTIARLLEKNKEKTDIATRFDGVKFVLVMPGSGNGAAEATTRRILDTLQDNPLELGDDLRVSISVSIGVSVHNQEHRFKSCDRLLKAADIALQRAKQNDQEHICLFQSSHILKSAK